MKVLLFLLFAKKVHHSMYVLTRVLVHERIALTPLIIMIRQLLLHVQ